MKIYNVFPILMIFLFSSFSIDVNNSFQYEYCVIASSNTPQDIAKGYEIKEKLIDMYEFLVFNSKDNVEEILRNNIDKFKFEKDVKPYYLKGRIYIYIKDALGISFKGKLRKNECDNAVIREKYFILEIFS